LGFVTVTAWTPKGEVKETVRSILIWMRLTTVTEEAVVPAPKETVKPSTNPLPEIVTALLISPWTAPDGVTLPITGTASTVKSPIRVWDPPSGLVTVTSLGPGGAVAATVTVARSVVALTNVVAPSERPDPLRLMRVPLWKSLPVTVSRREEPSSPRWGLTERTAGALLIVKSPFPTARPPSGLVTITSLPPVAASAATFRVTESRLELIKLVAVVEIPLPLNVTVAPEAKPLPLTVITCPLVPRARLFGVTLLTEGPPTTIRHPEQVPDFPSTFVTVTSLKPIEAAVAMLTGTVMVVLFTIVTGPGVISPEPPKETAAPLTKLEPVRVRIWLTAPCPKLLGLMELTAGAS
jgi:hypothetical protein